MRWFALALALFVVVAPVSGQDSTATPVRAAQEVSDTMTHRPPPLHYFWRSVLIPGWGQASLDRKLTGGIFVAFEGFALSMALKANSELHFFIQTGDTTLATSKRLERQDWYALLVINHLFAGLEAYVSANLVDFPRDLKIRPILGRRTGVGFSIGVGH